MKDFCTKEIQMVVAEQKKKNKTWKAEQTFLNRSPLN